MSKKKRGEERMKEEDNILKKVGRENSFKVPEGYFENLTSEVMGKLPEKEKWRAQNIRIVIKVPLWKCIYLSPETGNMLQYKNDHYDYEREIAGKTI